MTSISNDWRGGSSCCVMVEFVVYWFHNHSSLCLEMVIRWYPLLVNMSALSCMICMVSSIAFMLESGLHSFRCICTSVNCSGMLLC